MNPSGIGQEDGGAYLPNTAYCYLPLAFPTTSVEWPTYPTAFFTPDRDEAAYLTNYAYCSLSHHAYSVPSRPFPTALTRTDSAEGGIEE